MKHQKIFMSLTLLSVLSSIPFANASKKAATSVDASASVLCSSIDPKTLPKGTVLDPLYYRDAMKGLQSARDRLNTYYTTQKNFKPVETYQKVDDTKVPAGLSTLKFDKAYSLETLKLMQTWLAPTMRQYHQIETEGYWANLSACFNKDCVDDYYGVNRDITADEAMPKINNISGQLTKIYDDMNAKLKALQSCDPYVQTKLDPNVNTLANRLKALNRTIASKKAQLKKLTDACLPPANKPVTQDFSLLIDSANPSAGSFDIPETLRAPQGNYLLSPDLPVLENKEKPQ